MKKKLLIIVMGCIMCLSVVAIGVYALTTVNLGVTGSISFIAYDKQVYIEDITIKNFVEETAEGYKSTNKTYLNYQGVYLKNSNATVSLSGNVLQGETLEIDVTMVNLKSNFLKTILSYEDLPADVLIRSTGLYMPQNQGASVGTGQAKTLKIYITNKSTTLETLDLSKINLSVAFEEYSSLIHTGRRTEGDTENTIYYVEMGTLPGTADANGVATEEYLKWRYISADGTTAYWGTTAPTTTSGTYILETDVKEITMNNSTLRHDAVEDSNIGLCDVVFNNNATATGSFFLTYTSTENTNVYISDYAMSNLRKYMNGEKVYKSYTDTTTTDAAGNTIHHFIPNTTSHYSDMLTDFCIDEENDIIYNKIMSRSLEDLYSDIFDDVLVSDAAKAHYAHLNGYNMSQSDKFWSLSEKETINLLGNGTRDARDWNSSNNQSSYWLRSPDAAWNFNVYCVDGSGSYDQIFALSNCSARAAFKLA